MDAIASRTRRVQRLSFRMKQGVCVAVGRNSSLTSMRLVRKTLLRAAVWTQVLRGVRYVKAKRRGGIKISRRELFSHLDSIRVHTRVQRNALARVPAYWTVSVSGVAKPVAYNAVVALETLSRSSGPLGDSDIVFTDQEAGSVNEATGPLGESDFVFTDDEAGSVNEAAGPLGESVLTFEDEVVTATDDSFGPLGKSDIVFTDPETHDDSIESEGLVTSIIAEAVAIVVAAAVAADVVEELAVAGGAVLVDWLIDQVEVTSEPEDPTSTPEPVDMGEPGASGVPLEAPDDGSATIITFTDDEAGNVYDPVGDDGSTGTTDDGDPN